MYVCMYSGIPISRTSRRNANWFEKSGVKFQVKQIQGKQGLVRDIERFEKPRVREIGIPLYVVQALTGMIKMKIYKHKKIIIKKIKAQKGWIPTGDFCGVRQYPGEM